MTPAGPGHNQGPSLADYEGPPWGDGNAYGYVCWKRARRRAWRASRDVALHRLARAEALGLTYEEYTLEILERGRYLQVTDIARIAAIKKSRRGHDTMPKEQGVAPTRR